MHFTIEDRTAVINSRSGLTTILIIYLPALAPEYPARAYDVLNDPKIYQDFLLYYIPLFAHLPVFLYCGI